MTQDDQRLKRLSDLSGYKVADGDPDPRSWQVVTQDGTPVGRVEDLIIDREAERARYLDVRLDQPAATDRHVLVPTDAVHLGRDEQQQPRVEVAATMDYFIGVPAYTGLPLTEMQESEYRRCPPVTRGGGLPPSTRISKGEPTS